MKIIKECHISPLNPMTLGLMTCILRFDDDKPLTEKRIARLFKEAAKDFPRYSQKEIQVSNGGITLYPNKVPASYKCFRERPYV